MATRDPEREQYWRCLLEEWQASKLTAYAFCKERQLGKSTFLYWQRKLGFAGPRSPATPRAAFVPLTVSREVMAEVTVGSLTVRLPLAASAAEIERCLSAARSASC